MNGKSPRAARRAGRSWPVVVEDVVEEDEQTGGTARSERERAAVAAQLAQHPLGGRERDSRGHDRLRDERRNASSRSPCAGARPQLGRRRGSERRAFAHEQELVAALRLVHDVAGDEERRRRAAEARGRSPTGRGAARGRGRRSARRGRAGRARRGARSPARRASARRRRACRRPGRRARRGRRSRGLVDCGGGHAEHPGEVVEVLADGQVGVDGGRLGHVADRRRSSAMPGGPPSTVTRAGLDDLHADDRRIRVVLPEPLGPSSPVTVPGRTSRCRPREDEPPAPPDVKILDRDNRARGCRGRRIPPAASRRSRGSACPSARRRPAGSTTGRRGGTRRAKPRSPRRRS